MKIVAKICQILVCFGIIGGFCACGYKDDPYWDAPEKKHDLLLP